VNQVLLELKRNKTRHTFTWTYDDDDDDDDKREKEMYKAKGLIQRRASCCSS